MPDSVMAPAVRDGVLVAAMLILAWRALPAGQAVLATVLCAGALWLAFHPVLASNLLTAVVRLY
jgi:hypothetical protein